MLKNKYLLFFVTIFLNILSILMFKNDNIQSINWTFPYISGAANFDKVFDWKISPSDYKIAKSLTLNEYKNYKHKKTRVLVDNTVNNYGYVFVALISRKLFPFTGDINGIVLFQILTHISISLFLILFVFNNNLERFGFLFLYSINPLIIHFVTFPFYYFWMVIPSFLFIILIKMETWRNALIFIAIPIILFSLLIRPTTIFLVIFFYFTAFFVAKSVLDKFRAILAFLLFTSSFFFISSFFKSNAAPWHTMYVGIGAYSNNLGINKLSDEEGYIYFQNRTGINIDTDPVNGNYSDLGIRQNYLEELKNKYLSISSEHPELILRNALFNFFQVFSIGFIVGKPVLLIPNMIIGLIIIFFLVYTKNFIYLAAIISSACSFFLFFPPIPAYNFSAYLLLTMAILNGIKPFLLRINLLNKLKLKDLSFFYK